MDLTKLRSPKWCKHGRIFLNGLLKVQESLGWINDDATGGEVDFFDDLLDGWDQVFFRLALDDV